jgi:hypothetical protein
MLGSFLPSLGRVIATKFTRSAEPTTLSNQKRSRGVFARRLMRFGRAMDQINNGVPDCWMEVHDSYHKLFAPLPGQADITHRGGHFYESATTRH